MNSIIYSQNVRNPLPNHILPTPLGYRSQLPD